MCYLKKNLSVREYCIHLLCILVLTLTGCAHSEEGGVSTVPSNTDGAGSEYAGVTTLETGSAENPVDDFLPAQITVQESVQLKAYTPDLFGLNYSWNNTGHVLLDPATNEFDPEAAMLSHDVGFSLNRMSGSESQKFKWKAAIGPFEGRAPQKLWSWAKTEPILCGPIEWIEWLEAQNPDASVAWVVNMAQDSAEDMRDLAEFLVTEDTPWGARRAELGLGKAVNVKIWELGNEMDWVQHKWTVDHYIEEARKAIAAIRSVDPNAVFAAHASTSPWHPSYQQEGKDWRDWHREVLRELGDEIDYIAFHPYYSGIPIEMVDRYIGHLEEDIQEVTGSNRIGIFISEHARWPAQPKTGEWRDNWFQTHSLDGCLATSLFIARCMQRPSVTAAVYHSFSDGPWGLLYRDRSTNRLYSTGMMEVFRLLSDIRGDYLPQVNISGLESDPSRPDFAFTVSAVASDSELALLVVNRGGARQANFSFEKQYHLKKGSILTADSLDAFNSSEEKPLEYKKAEFDVGEPPFTQITIPEYSISLITLERIQ